MYMSGDGERDGSSLTSILLRLLDRDKPAKVEQPAASRGVVVEITPPLTTPARPRSRLSRISEGRGRDMRQLSELPDSEVIKLAKRGGRILRPGDVAKVRSTAGRNGAAADIIDAMDQNGLFES